MVDGPALTPNSKADITSASLTGPSGPVEVLIADNFTPDVGIYLPPGGMLIPRNALAPGASYTAQLSATVQPQGGQPIVFERSWSFSTRPLDNVVRITTTVAEGFDITLSTESAAPGGVVNATGPGGARASAPIDADRNARVRVGRGGEWNLCAVTGGGATGYREASACTAVTVATPPAGVRLSFASKLARPRARRLSVRVRCSRACSVRAAATLRRKGRKSARLAQASARRSRAGVVTLRFKLSRSQAKMLRSKRARRGYKLSVVVTDAWGTQARKTLRIR